MQISKMEFCRVFPLRIAALKHAFGESIEATAPVLPPGPFAPTFYWLDLS